MYNISLCFSCKHTKRIDGIACGCDNPECIYESTEVTISDRIDGSLNLKYRSKSDEL